MSFGGSLHAPRKCQAHSAEPAKDDNRLENPIETLVVSPVICAAIVVGQPAIIPKRGVRKLYTGLDPVRRLEEDYSLQCFPVEVPIVSVPLLFFAWSALSKSDPEQYSETLTPATHGQYLSRSSSPSSRSLPGQAREGSISLHHLSGCQPPIETLLI